MVAGTEGEVARVERFRIVVVVAKRGIGKIECACAIFHVRKIVSIDVFVVYSGLPNCFASVAREVRLKFVSIVVVV